MNLVKIYIILGFLLVELPSSLLAQINSNLHHELNSSIRVIESARDLRVIRDTNGKCGLVDSNNKIICPLNYDFITVDILDRDQKAAIYLHRINSLAHQLPQFESSTPTLSYDVIAIRDNKIFSLNENFHEQNLDLPLAEEAILIYKMWAYERFFSESSFQYDNISQFKFSKYCNSVNYKKVKIEVGPRIYFHKHSYWLNISNILENESNSKSSVLLATKITPPMWNDLNPYSGISAIRTLAGITFDSSFFNKNLSSDYTKYILRSELGYYTFVNDYGLRCDLSTYDTINILLNHDDTTFSYYFKIAKYASDSTLKWGLLDSNLEIILDPIYQEIGQQTPFDISQKSTKSSLDLEYYKIYEDWRAAPTGMVRIKLNDKYGFFSINDQSIIPPVYTTAFGLFKNSSNSWVGFVSKNGEKFRINNNNIRIK